MSWLRLWSAWRLGLLHAVLTVPLGLSQHVVGIGITLARDQPYLLRLSSDPSRSDLAAQRSNRSSPGRSRDCPSIPVLGEALFTQTPFDLPRLHRDWHCRLAALPDAARAGDPRSRRNLPAVEAQGLSVTGIRRGAVMAGSALHGCSAGRFSAMSAFNSFFFEMVNGRGWICIALVVFGSWRPGKALLGAVLFAAFDAYQVRLQQLSGGIPPLSDFPDDALRAVHPGAYSRCPARGLSQGPDGALSEGREIGKGKRAGNFRSTKGSQLTFEVDASARLRYSRCKLPARASPRPGA